MLPVLNVKEGKLVNHSTYCGNVMYKNLFFVTPLIASIIFLVYIAGRLSLSNEPALALIPATILVGGVVYYVLWSFANEDSDID